MENHEENPRPWISFNDPAVLRDVEVWWTDLQKSPGDRARLCRCYDLTDVAFTAGYGKLRTTLLKHGNLNPQALALVAGVLAHVRENTGGEIRSPAPVAVQMAFGKPGSDSARVSDLRFRRLIQTQEPAALYPAMIRTIRLLDRSAHLPSLAKGLYWWNDLTRQTWTFAYDETGLMKKPKKEE